MQLNHERPDYAYALRSASGDSARVNDRVLTRSFVLSPSELREDWAPSAVSDLIPDHLAPLLEMQPEVILLGTGDRQVFPPAVVMAAGLTRGVGIEIMTNAAAARTFNVLAGEGRRVAAGFLIAPR